MERQRHRHPFPEVVLQCILANREEQSPPPVIDEEATDRRMRSRGTVVFSKSTGKRCSVITTAKCGRAERPGEGSGSDTTAHEWSRRPAWAEGAQGESGEESLLRRTAPLSNWRSR